MITVIGGGPAGRFAASYLAGAGEKVRIIEKSGNLGGQCLKYGCMVTCGLNDAARNLNQLTKLRKLRVLDAGADAHVSMQNLWKELGAIQNTIFKVLDNEANLAGIEVITGEVSLAGRDVYINGALLQQSDADKILIATGSYPIIPKIKGIDLKGVYNPHTLQSLKEVPNNLLIIGGGVIAAEYAYIFSQFGSNVTVVCRSAFLRDKPERLIYCARKEMPDVSVREYTLVEEIKSAEGSDSSGFAVSAVLKSGKNREEIPCDAVIVASGLRPRSDNLKGIALDREIFPQVFHPDQDRSVLAHVSGVSFLRFTWPVPFMACSQQALICPSPRSVNPGFSRRQIFRHSLHRGAKLHPFGGFSRSIGVPSIGISRSWPSASSRGMDASSPFV